MSACFQSCIYAFTKSKDPKLFSWVSDSEAMEMKPETTDSCFVEVQFYN